MVLKVHKGNQALTVHPVCCSNDNSIHNSLQAACIFSCQEEGGHTNKYKEASDNHVKNGEQGTHITHVLAPYFVVWMAELLVSFEFCPYLLFPLAWLESSPVQPKLILLPFPSLLKDGDPHTHDDWEAKGPESNEVIWLKLVQRTGQSKEAWYCKPHGVEVLERVEEAPSFSKVVSNSSQMVILLILVV